MDESAHEDPERSKVVRARQKASQAGLLGLSRYGTSAEIKAAQSNGNKREAPYNKANDKQTKAMQSNATATKIRQLLLAKGIKAASFGTVQFLTIIGHAFSYQASAVMLL